MWLKSEAKCYENETIKEGTDFIFYVQSDHLLFLSFNLCGCHERLTLTSHG